MVQPVQFGLKASGRMPKQGVFSARYHIIRGMGFADAKKACEQLAIGLTWRIPREVAVEMIKTFPQFEIVE